MGEKKWGHFYLAQDPDYSIVIPSPVLSFIHTAVRKINEQLVAEATKAEEAKAGAIKTVTEAKQEAKKRRGSVQ